MHPTVPCSRATALALPLLLAATSLATAQRPTWGSRNVAPPARQQHATAFDGARGSTLVFGGLDQNGNPLQDTWDWDGRAWVHHLPTNSPPARFGHAMAFDPQRGRTVLFGGLPATTATTPLLDTWEWDGGDWIQNQAPISLTGRYGHAMVWFGGTNPELLLHGGRGSTTGSPSQETWAYNGYQWALRAQNGPSGYANSALAYVPALQRAVFVGSSNLGQANQWTWNGSGWSQVSPSGNVPIVQYGHSLCFDAARNRLVLAGGQNGAFGSDFTYFGNLTSGTQISWTASYNQNAQSQFVPESRTYGALAYDSVRQRAVFCGGQSLLSNQILDSLHELPQGAAWTTNAPITTSPSPRLYTNMAYDQTHGQSVLFGGWNNGVMGDTWTFDGSTWTNRGTSPFVAPRRSTALAHLPTTGITLLFGGTNHTGAYYDDTQRWDGNSWSPQGLSVQPSPRSDHKMVYDTARNRIVLFGGYGPNGSLGDTWEYDPTNATSPWAQIATTGAPPSRHAHGMAYEARRQRTVVFGGSDQNGLFLDDTWIYRGSSQGWTQLNTVYTPAKRWNPVMDYDAGRGMVVVGGGYGYPQCGNYCATHLDDLWELHDYYWVARTYGPWPILSNWITTTRPAPREGAAMVYDTRLQQHVQFGGADASGFHPETSILRAVVDASNSGQIGGGLSIRSAEYPVSGGTVAFQLPNAANVGWFTIKLEPVPDPTLGWQGALGVVCAHTAWFYGQNPISLMVLGNPGELRFGLPLGLAGLSMTVQGMALDPNGTCLQVSQPLNVTVQGQ